MNRDNTSKNFRIADLHVWPNRLAIEVGGVEQKVEPRVMEILVFLASSQPSTVSRESLREALWDAHVSDDAIHRAIWKLRRALGPRPDLLETVAKRGYRLTAPVEWCTDDEDLVRPLANSRQNKGVRVLALLGILSVLLVAWSLVNHDARKPLDVKDPRFDFEPVTSLPGYETQPDLHAQSRRVVFTNFQKEGDSPNQWDLWTRTLDDGRPQRMTATAAHEMSPALSPSGAKVAFVRMQGDDCGFGIVHVATGIEQPLDLDCGAKRDPSDCCRAVGWHSEDRLLVTRREVPTGPIRIYEVELSADGVVAMHSISDPPSQFEGDVDFARSRDGRRLAVVRRRSLEAGDLYVLDLETGVSRQVTTGNYPISGVTWSEDDQDLIFGWRRTGESVLWQVPANGGVPQPTRTIGMNASNPVARGDELIYEEWKSEINIWMLDLDGSSAHPEVQSTLWDWSGSPSPDGTLLAFLSNREGSQEVWLRAGAEHYPLTTLDGRIASGPVWRPDGGAIAVAVVGTQSIDIATVEVNSKAVRWVVTDASDERDPRYSANGGELYFSSNRTGDWEAYSASLETGMVERWTTIGAVAARPAHDGLGIWFVGGDSRGLWRQEAADSEATLILGGFNPIAPTEWTVNREPDRDGEVIYFNHLTDSGAMWMSRLDPKTGEIENLVRLDDGSTIGELYPGNLWVNALGTRALVGSVDQSHSDLWLRKGMARESNDR